MVELYLHSSIRPRDSLTNSSEGQVCFNFHIGWSLDSQRGGPGSSPGQVMWDLWWTKRAWGQVFCEYFRFPCQSFHRLLHTQHHPPSGASSGRCTERTQSHSTDRAQVALWSRHDKQSARALAWRYMRPGPDRCVEHRHTGP
jgi:hypothetical protein